MKANDLMQIFELGKTFAKTDRPKRRKNKPTLDFDFSEYDLSMLLQKKLQEADTIKKFLDDHQKANKKEEHKKEGWSMTHLAMFLMATFPITAPLYVGFVKSLFH